MFCVVSSFRSPSFWVSWLQLHHRASKILPPNLNCCESFVNAREFGLRLLLPLLRMTVAMMSRITISLKSSVEAMKNVDVVRPVLPSMFTQNSRMDVASNIRIVAPGFNQTKSVDSLNFGLDMSTNGLRGNQSISAPANRLGLGATTILTPNRRKLSTIQQEPLDWEQGNGFSTISPRVLDSAVGDSVWLNTIEEKPIGV